MDDSYQLNRFIEAQSVGEPIDYQTALKEIVAGLKIHHWIWYIFPQLDGLVNTPSYKTFKYSIKSKEEALAYFYHPILGARLVEISQAILSLDSDNIRAIVGETDTTKIKSCMTLFDAITDENTDVFSAVLDKYYQGEKDEKTLNLLNTRKNRYT